MTGSVNNDSIPGDESQRTYAKVCNSMPDSLSKVCCHTGNEDLKFRPYCIHAVTEGKILQYYW
jgi:hypothetical protein